MGAGALRDGGDPDSRLRRADADDDARQAVGPPRGRVGRGARPAAREPGLAGGGGRRGLPAPFPLFVKPRWEGTAKGIGPSSRVESREALVAEVARVVGTYGQPALVEAFLEGPGVSTVTLVGTRPRALPTLQRALEASTRIGAHALLRHPPPPGGWRHVTPGALDAALEAELVALGRRAFEALECRDFARADFRLDGDGRPYFLEMNPLPTFAPDGSFGIIAELLGRPARRALGGGMPGGRARPARCRAVCLT